jgi:thymidylate kinase
METVTVTCSDEGQPISLQAFLEHFFGALADRGIGYCVLRNHAKLPADNSGTDIDILVKPERVEECIELLRKFAPAPLTGCARHAHCVSLFVPGVRWSGGEAIQIDLIRQLAWKGLNCISISDVLQRAHTPPGRHEIIRVPAAADEAVVSLFSSYMVGGWIKERYQVQVRETFLREGETIQRNLAPAFGADLANQLVDAVKADDQERMLSMLPKLRRALLFRSMKRAPLATLGLLMDHYGRVLIIRFTPRALGTISILGPDGAGKSSLLEPLRTRLAHTTKPITVRHLKPDIFFRAHRQSHGIVTDPHGKPPRSLFISVLKLVLWAFEIWIDRLFSARSGSDLELWDRYYHDVLVDPKRYRYRGPMWLVRTIGWFVPSPDLLIVLDAPTEVLQARKREVAAEETERQRQVYRALAGQLKRAVVIDADRPVDQVVSDAAVAIIARMAEKTWPRLRMRI